MIVSPRWPNWQRQRIQNPCVVGSNPTRGIMYYNYLEHDSGIMEVLNAIGKPVEFYDPDSMRWFPPQNNTGVLKDFRMQNNGNLRFGLEYQVELEDGIQVWWPGVKIKEQNNA